LTGIISNRDGIIIAHHGVAVEIRYSSGERSMVRVKRSSGHVVGDAVVVRGEVLERLARSTELRRRDATGSVHLVGANLDVLGIVVSPAPQPPAGFIDQAIVAARAANLLPFVVVNKCDLPISADFVSKICATYADVVAVFPLSAVTGVGLDALRAFFAAGHRGAFVGTSGVGKSSLLNALCPEIDLQVNTLNDHTGKGRQTTTVSTLHSLSSGGELIDTPGFQDFGLIGISAAELSLYFPGFEQSQAVSCRFRNCRHRTEPGCAISALVTQQQIPAERYATYLEILSEVESGMEEDRCRGWKR
jgi:ribosome biogenesis GTPase